MAKSVTFGMTSARTLLTVGSDKLAAAPPKGKLVILPTSPTPESRHTLHQLRHTFMSPQAFLLLHYVERPSKSLYVEANDPLLSNAR